MQIVRNVLSNPSQIQLPEIARYSSCRRDRSGAFLCRVCCKIEPSDVVAKQGPGISLGDGKRMESLSIYIGFAQGTVDRSL
jgi:hypothetical protein